MRLAVKTLKAIDDAIESDKGTLYRHHLKFFLPLMDDAYRATSKPHRAHLGASLIGADCPRQLWYSYRWAKVKEFSARILRLFNRGHLEEARFLAMLKMIGCKLWYETPDGGQIKFSDINGHFGSALDGIVRGCPDLPQDVAAYTEFKTSADKGFKKLVKEGVASAKHEHYVQMQICMHEMGLSYALYMCVNKNDDDLHAEIITYHSETANTYVDRAKSIIYGDRPPPKINDSIGWWQCRFCDYKDICHQDAVPEINCRTCVHSTASDDPEKAGEWTCERKEPFIDINSDDAFDGCDEHVFNPYMLNGVEYRMGNNAENSVSLVMPNGERIKHGPDYVTSQELQAKGLK